jgi:hypothetical protein
MERKCIGDLLGDPVVLEWDKSHEDYTCDACYRWRDRVYWHDDMSAFVIKEAIRRQCPPEEVPTQLTEARAVAVESSSLCIT